MTTTHAPRRGGWYHGWNIVAVAVISQIAAYGLPLNSISLFLNDWARDLHSPISHLLLAMAPLAWVSAIASPIAGALADKRRARWLFGIGLAGIGLFCYLMSTVTATWQLCLLYGTLYPVSVSLCTSVAATALVSRWFVRRIGLALGGTAIGMGASGVLLPPLIALVMPTIGWRAVWLDASFIITFVVLPIVTLVVRDRPGERDGPLYLTSAEAALHRSGESGGGLRWSDILRQKNFWLLGICFLPIVALYNCVQQNLAPIAAVRGLDPKVAGLLLAVLSLAHVTGTIVLGLISDRCGNRVPFAATALLVTVGGVLVGFGGSLPLLLAGSALVGFSGGIWAVLPAALRLQFGASGVGRAFGMLMLFVPVNSAAPAIIAKVQELTGSYGPGLMVLGVMSLLAGGIILLLRENGAKGLAIGDTEAVREEAAPHIA
jgi:MFS family permease